jgi:F0F1-type ATP synthase membrane subunit b/b'
VLLGAALLAPVGRADISSPDHRLAWTTTPQGAEEEGHEKKNEALFKWINFALLVGGLGYILRKPLREFFSQRSASIRNSLEEGRKALESSQAQLAAVEGKLGRLEAEIKAFKASVARDIHAERERLQKEAAVEAERILASGRTQIEATTKAARVELKSYAAQQAVRLAEQMIRERLDDTVRRRLVSQFVEGLKN